MSCSWRYDKCQKKVPGHSFNFTGYKTMTFKICDPGSVYNADKAAGMFKTAKECVQKCTADPRCAAAEWFRSGVHESTKQTHCYFSSDCPLNTTQASRRISREQTFLFLKQNFTKPKQNFTKPKNSTSMYHTFGTVLK